MRKINLDTWPRREHFNVFRTLDYPHFSLCANLDLTIFYHFVKQHGNSLNIAIVYMISKAANAIPEFRYRIRGETLVEHEVVHPSCTIMAKDEVFSFCTVQYLDDFTKFTERASQKIERVKMHPRLLEEDQNRDDLLFMTAIPWVSFTSFMHPLHLNPADSVPRFAWGKFFEEGDQLKIPLSVQGHHAVMDGLHMGRFYEQVQDYFLKPEESLSIIGK